MGFVQVSVGDFSSLGFAAGSVRGARAFEVAGGYNAGILTGIVYRQWWLPGEMRCTCLRRVANNEVYAIMYNEGAGVDIMDRPDDFPDPDHTMDDCEHGLYAFYDGSNDYNVPGAMRIQGIIQGYGEVMIGERGFRASKARIVALSDEGRNNHDKEAVRLNYSAIPWFDTFDEMVAAFPLGEV